MNIDIFDSKEPLIEKIMAHFGWYKVKKVEMQVENLEINHIFTVKSPKEELPPFPAPKKKPALKKATTRKVTKNGK